MNYTQLTPSQAQLIFMGLNYPNQFNQLRSLEVINIDLSGINPSELTKVITRLEHVNLSYTQLGTAQIEALFAGLTPTSPLRSLDISNNSLVSVEGNALARVVNRMEIVKMERTSLSLEQTTAILSHSLGTTNLKTLIIDQ